jgi:FkbM family methyltransferase
MMQIQTPQYSPTASRSLWDKTLVQWRSHLPLGPQRVVIDNITLQIPPATSARIRKTLWNGSYEAPELDLAKKHLNRGDRVLEVGTGLGLLSIYCAQHLGSDRVYTYEANPAMVQPILTNYDLNGVCPRFENCLIGQNEGSELFYIGKHFWSSSTLNRAEGARPVRVKVKSFNQEIQRIRPTAVILDIEGGEHELMQYAEFPGVRKLMIELHGWVLNSDQCQHVRSRIQSAGFRLVEERTRENLYFER